MCANCRTSWYEVFVHSSSIITAVHVFLQPPELRQQIIHAYTKSIGLLWIVNTPVAVACFLLTLFLKKYTLKRIVIHGGHKPGADAEHAGPPSNEVDAEILPPTEEKSPPDEGTEIGGLF